MVALIDIYQSRITPQHANKRAKYGQKKEVGSELAVIHGNSTHENTDRQMGRMTNTNLKASFSK